MTDPRVMQRERGDHGETEKLRKELEQLKQVRRGLERRVEALEKKGAP